MCFTRKYFAGVKIMDHEVRDNLCNLKAIGAIVSNEIFKTKPVRATFRRTVLKTIITKAETAELEIPDSLYTALADAMSESDDFSYRMYLTDNGEHIRCSIRESNQQLCHGTTGLSVWQASCDLAAFMTYFMDCRDKHILELGAGCGLAGISTAASFPSCTVDLTDYDPKVLQQLELNVAASNLADPSKVRVLPLEWSSFSVDDLDMIPDFIIAADVVYDKQLCPPLINVIRSLLDRNPGAIAYIACTVRDSETVRHFRRLLEEAHFRIDQCSFERETIMFLDCSQIKFTTKYPFHSTLESPTILFQLLP
ncbi:unnamed protein product [Auanema sp. JU1783]|nr:unnamed protein product [Auanema sp. JU1783]